MVIKEPTTPFASCHTTLWSIWFHNAVINDKLQGSVATYLRCGGIVNNHNN